jgi:hypothetical protein
LRPADLAVGSARRSSRYGLADRQPAPEVPAHAAPAPPIHRVSPAKQRDHPCAPRRMDSFAPAPPPETGRHSAGLGSAGWSMTGAKRPRPSCTRGRRGWRRRADRSCRVGARTRARCAKPCGRAAGHRLEPGPGWPDPRRSGAPPAARRTLRSVALPPPGYAREPRRLGLIGAAHDGSAESREALEVAAGWPRSAMRGSTSWRSRATSIWTSARTDHGSSPRPRRGARGNRSHRSPDRARDSAGVRRRGARRRAACWPSGPSLDPLVLGVTAARPRRAARLGCPRSPCSPHPPPARSAAPLATRRRDCARWLASWLFFPRRRRAAGRPWRREARRCYTGAPVHPSVR